MANRSRCRLWLLVALCVGFIWPSAASAQKRQPPNFEQARNRMVDDEVVGAGITNPRVIQSMRITPRHEFVALKLMDKAYLDMSLPIGEHQTISPPMMVAFESEQLDPQPTDRVLEIGTGKWLSGGRAQPAGQRGVFDRNR